MQGKPHDNCFVVSIEQRRCHPAAPSTSEPLNRDHMVAMSLQWSLSGFLFYFARFGTPVRMHYTACDITDGARIHSAASRRKTCSLCTFNMV